MLKCGLLKPHKWSLSRRSLLFSRGVLLPSDQCSVLSILSARISSDCSSRSTKAYPLPQHWTTLKCRPSSRFSMGWAEFSVANVSQLIFFLLPVPLPLLYHRCDFLKILPSNYLNRNFLLPICLWNSALLTGKMQQWIVWHSLILRIFLNCNLIRTW